MFLYRYNPLSIPEPCPFGHLPEPFRQIRRYLLEQFRHLRRYLHSITYFYCLLITEWLDHSNIVPVWLLYFNLNQSSSTELTLYALDSSGKKKQRKSVMSIFGLEKSILVRDEYFLGILYDFLGQHICNYVNCLFPIISGAKTS